MAAIQHPFGLGPSIRLDGSPERRRGRGTAALGAVAQDLPWLSHDNFDIYVTDIRTRLQTRLTQDPAEDFSPVWSPDGTQIAFARFDPKTRRSGIFTVPAPLPGGAERHRAELHLPVQVNAASQNPGRVYSSLSWSPVSPHTLAFADREKATDPVVIFLLNLETGERTRLTDPPKLTDGDQMPVFSPDGKQLAFMRRTSRQVGQIHIVSLPDGKTWPLTRENQRIGGLAWTPDSRDIVFSSIEGVGGIWRIPAAGGNREPLPFLSRGGEGAWDVVVAPKGGRLAYQRVMRDSPIWRIERPRTPDDRPVISPFAHSSHSVEPASGHLAGGGFPLTALGRPSDDRLAVFEPRPFGNPTDWGANAQSRRRPSTGSSAHWQCGTGTAIPPSSAAS